ncbi:TPA: OmpH family outer membrane protein [Candidatus Galligastranaerophilus gallistercoris]|nr:OmpH family outer membrane protein [Candidatus Galligastranaerophilus gallistercoris]
MRNKIIALLLVMLISTPVFAQTVGSVNYRQLITNYSKAKTAMSELEDKTNELQRYLLDKEKEFKKIDSAVQKKNFEDQTARAFAQKQDALEKYRQKKEAEIDTAINNAIKQVAMENKIDTVLDSRVVFYGGIDITDKVLKKLNFATAGK